MIRPEEQSEKTESCREKLWNEIQLKRAVETEIDTKTEQKEWVNSVGLCQT